MPNPGKSASVITQHGQSHEAKSKLARRKASEAAQLTGVKIRERREVKDDPVAHAEFLRVAKLLVIIGKNDAIYEAVINRYCTLQSECSDLEEKRQKFSENLDNLMDDDRLDADKKYALEAQMQKTIIDVDKQIQQKRKMLFDIERENGMTLAAALRSIPKQENKASNPLAEALKDDSDE